MAASRSAVFATVENELQMQFVPMLLGKQCFEIAFRLQHRFSAGEFPALCKSMNMGVDREGRRAKALCHDNLCGFVADAGQILEFFKRFRNSARVLLDENFREANDGLRFLSTESAQAELEISAQKP